MNYDALEGSYWTEQQRRVDDLREKINARGQTLPGRVMPDDESLAIGEGRRLAMAVLFLDISAFSQRPSATAEEQDMNLRVLNLFFTEMMRIAEDYGGTVEKNTGDGLMAHFEDAGHGFNGGAKRAISAALTMMAANHYLIRPVLEATPTKEIEFRVSIDYGQVTIAKLGAAKRFNSTAAIGSTPNFAAKMLSKASAGEIVLGASAREQLPREWQTQFTELVTMESGWNYTLNGWPYPLYRYTGRWVRTV
jgi:class 3 adenylate cyclase